MGMFSDDSGKTEQATPQRLSEAREKGQTPVSKEFTMAGTLLLAVLTLESFGYLLMESFQTMLRDGMSLTRDWMIDDVSLLASGVVRVLMTPFPIFTAFLILFFVATALFGYGQIGIKVSKKALEIKFDRLNPITGFGKLFKLAQLVKAVMSAFKLMILGGVLWFVLVDSWGVFVTLYEQDFVTAVTIIGGLAMRVVFWISLSVLVLSIIDIIYQRLDYKKKLMMSKQEVEDERKRSDGDPLIKSRMRQARLELARQRMMDEVPDATSIITNPTHYAVAVRYDRNRDAAPKVVAKGVDEIARRIREIAAEHDVPIVEDPPLARALYRSVKVGHEIPEKFYRAVATVLSHVFRANDRIRERAGVTE